MEMSSFLSEFGCPHAGVSSGEFAQRFRTRENCLLLLDYLLTELQAAQMTHANHPRPPTTPTGQAPTSLHSGELKAICITLGMSRPPANITTFQFFTGVEKKLREFLSKVPQDHIGKPLMKRAMAPGQWAQLDIINRKLSEEYRVRREMLLKRLDVTIQSFNWSDRTKGREDAVAQAFRPKRQGLSTQTNVILADLLAAREDIARIQKTSYGATRHNCAINKVLMGREALVEAEGDREVDMEAEGTGVAVLGEGECKEAGRMVETTAAAAAVEGAAAGGEVAGAEVVAGGEGAEVNITSSSRGAAF
ncbi:PREDICTED: protein FAM98A-like [Branchiostoma belcheri]|uniref:Protein FAM98A-like n=1 Tax=Branchiostoma belcheri TaxID=7741 RepID=A0A6P4ZM27_BRABE|nr:PREDICTED: protein FAM98A-like [Branchiostoma belcheri]